MKTSTASWRALCLAFALVAMATGAEAQVRNVTLRLNTSTIPDTIKTTSRIDVRGAVGSTAPFTLPDGKVIDWGDATTVRPVNVGGDYWQVNFDAPTDQPINFKFFSHQAEAAGIGGWEHDPNKTIPAGTRDTVLTLHYFEWQGRPAPNNYAWRPWPQKQDSIAVRFRVYMNTADAIQKGYNPGGAMPVGVRGDNLSGASMLDWGATNVTLQRELEDTPSNRQKAGFHLYSGVAYYPLSAAGQTQAYKFFVGMDGWENDYSGPGASGGNRTFRIPARDTTLYYTTFSNQKPLSGVAPVAATVNFSVDLAPLEQIGIYSRSRGDTLEVRGGFNGWDCAGVGSPDDCLMTRRAGTTRYGAAVPLTLPPDTELEYKYYIRFNSVPFQQEFNRRPPSGWEEPIHLTGINRRYTFTNSAEQNVPLQFFNGILPGNVIPAGNFVDVTWRVDMRPALTFAAQPFNPTNDTVYVRVEDPIWAFTQNLPLSQTGDPQRYRQLSLRDADGDGIYEGTFRVTGPTYSGIGYRYEYGNATSNAYFGEPSVGTSQLGRRRTRFILPSGGNWPTTYSFTPGQPEVFQTTQGALPFECNPAATGDNAHLNQQGCLPSGNAGTAVEDVGGEVPSVVTLSASYPNPFTGTARFQYSIPAAQHVTVKVYDLMGREVATLVDALQAASTYEVSFDGDGLGAGTYFYRLTAGGKTSTRSMVLVK